jgi:hypothetical protein
MLHVLTQAGIDLLEENGHLVGSEEFSNRGQRLVEEDGPRGARSHGKEISAQVDLHKLGSCVLELT